jgi:hypothetical protein
MTREGKTETLRASRFRLGEFWSGPGVWIILFLAALNVVVGLWRADLVVQRRENLLIEREGDASKSETTPRGKTARYEMSVGEDPQAYWGSIPGRERSRLVILSGMSQMYAINDRRQGDQTISEWLDDSLSAGGARVWGIAAPNLSNEEAIFQLIMLLQDPGTRPHVFIYGVCFDKFRNIDLRPGYQAFLRSRPQAVAAWDETARRYGERYPQASEKMLRTLAELRKTEAREKGTVESSLREWIGRFVPLVAARQDLNAKLQLQLFLARNALLGITPTSKRPIIQSRYDLNRQFLGMLAEVAEEHGVQFLAYVIPLNPLADNPYVPQQYEEFKRWLVQFAERKGIPFANLENAVPHEEWGEFMGGADFKHFRGPGHKRTAESLLGAFGDILAARRRGDPA